MTREELDRLVKDSNNSCNVFFTKSGAKLTFKEHKFINEFLIDGDLVASVKQAGFAVRVDDEAHYRAIGKRILAKPYIYDELVYHIEEMQKGAIADAEEVMTYFTNVMRGVEKDQFGLDAPLSERTAAAKELAKRLIDIPQKATEDERAIQIVLDWKRPANDEEQ